MTGEERLIDNIVRDVLTQLRRGEQSSRAEPARTKPASGGRQPTVALNNSVPAESKPAPVTIDAPVITAELLETRLNGATAVVIPPQAVLTPSGRDVVRARGLNVTRCGANGRSAIARWKVLLSGTTPALDRALDDATGSSLTFTGRAVVGTNGEAAKSAAGLICRAECDGAVVFTAQPHTVACLANRNSRVRAAVAVDVQSLKSIAAAMGANVVCVDPSDRPYFDLKNILRQIESAGAPTAPADWPE